MLQLLLLLLLLRIKDYVRVYLYAAELITSRSHRLFIHHIGSRVIGKCVYSVYWKYKITKDVDFYSTGRFQAHFSGANTELFLTRSRVVNLLHAHASRKTKAKSMKFFLSHFAKERERERERKRERESTAHVCFD